MRSYCPIVFILLVSSSAYGSILADLNGDDRVNNSDANIWSSNLFQDGTTFEQGDIDGDGRTGIMGDGNAIVCQLEGQPTVFSTVTADYDENLGEGTLEVHLDFDSPTYFNGVSALYLVNDAGAIEFTTIGTGLVRVEDESNAQAFSPSGDGIAAYSPFNTLGTASDILFRDFQFSVPSGTQLEDLLFYYQRSGEELIPLPITSTVTGATHLPELPDGFCSCPVPEPAVPSWIGALLAMIWFRRKK